MKVLMSKTYTQTLNNFILPGFTLKSFNLLLFCQILIVNVVGRNTMKSYDRKAFN